MRKNAMMNLLKSDQVNFIIPSISGKMKRGMTTTYKRIFIVMRYGLSSAAIESLYKVHMSRICLRFSSSRAFHLRVCSLLAMYTSSTKRSRVTSGDSMVRLHVLYSVITLYLIKIKGKKVSPMCSLVRGVALDPAPG